MKYRFLIFAFSLWLHLSYRLVASNIVVQAQTTLIDRQLVPFNQLSPGDTIYMQAGLWDNLEIRNFKGTSGKPYIFVNKGGIVKFSTDHNHAISIQNCKFFRLTGTGFKSDFYGIQIDKVENGAGIGIGKLSSDYEIDHVSIKNVPIAGIYAKTDPDCSGQTTREFFIQYNTSIHDNYIENAGNEGLYIGNTKYFGQTVKCNDKDTIVYPSLLDGVKIYNNIIRNSGWDGIQVSSASKNCKIFGNKVYNDSQGEVLGQMSGIIIGGGSKCDCYNNYIADGKGDGIEIHGIGGSRIFNNIIVNPGMTYYPANFESAKMKHGIFVSDVSTQKDSSFFILNNTIIDPKSDGIRFSSTVSKKNLIASNVVINPGNFDYYENGNFRFKGVDSYIMITDISSDIRILNNFFSKDLVSSGLDQAYKPEVGSPLINSGYPGPPFISFDFSNSPRLPGNRPDIGAFEYQIPDGIAEFESNQTKTIELFPNPADQSVTVTFFNLARSDVDVEVYSVMGQKLLIMNPGVVPAGWNQVCFDIQALNPGTYFLVMRFLGSISTMKFVKK